MKKETRSDGTMIKQEWDCCHLLSRTGADGMTTAYSYDGLDRMVREERDGPNGNKIITATDYSASGNERITVRTVSDGSGNSLSTKTVADLAGRTIYSEDAAGLKEQHILIKTEDGKLIVIHKNNVKYIEVNVAPDKMPSDAIVGARMI